MHPIIHLTSDTENLVRPLSFFLPIEKKKSYQLFLKKNLLSLQLWRKKLGYDVKIAYLFSSVISANL